MFLMSPREEQQVWSNVPPKAELISIFQIFRILKDAGSSKDSTKCRTDQIRDQSFNKNSVSRAGRSSIR